jgi:heptosyltransferase II
LKKILIIQTAFLGDVILSTPLIEKIRNLYPEATIDFLLRKGNEGVLEHHPYLHTVLVWDKKKNKYKNLFSLLRKIRSEKYDLVINPQRFAATGFLTAFSGAAQKVGFDKNPFSCYFTHKSQHSIHASKKQQIHECDRNLQLISFLGGNDHFGPKLYPSQIDYSETSKFKEKPYICIAPASVWFTKQFPEAKWIEFINAVPEKYTIYLLGASDDAFLCEAIAQKSVNKNISVLAGKLSILKTAALMRDAQMNYVNDSAPMHIASAMNAPVSAIFCSTIPAFGFGPLSEKSYIIEVPEDLTCRPCGIHGKRNCPEKHFNCAFHIKTDSLLEKIF